MLHWAVLFEFLSTGPLIRISVIFAEFAQRQDCRRVLEDLYRHEEVPVVDVFCCFLMCLHFPSGLDTRTPVRPSSGLSCLACALMLRNLPQIIIPRVSSKMVQVVTKTSEGENYVVFPLSLSLWKFFVISHASLRAHCSCCKVSS